MPRLRCPVSGFETNADATDFRSPAGYPMEVVHAYPPVSRAMFDGRMGSLDSIHASGVWRFKELVYPSLPSEHVITRPEGNTSLMSAPGISSWTGVADLRLKHEGLNPTGSFKDRGMTVAMSQAAHLGARAVVCASTGNTSAAVAAYAAIANIPAFILVPDGKTAIGKLTQSIAYGATTVMIQGDFDDAMRLVQQHATELGLYLLNSINPFRLEGQKAIMFELLQQLRWESPDWVVFPAGNLGNCAAFGKALQLAHDLNLIRRVPRLLAVQAAGAAPFAAAYERGFDKLIPVKAETLATAIRIGDPVSYQRAVESIRRTHGVVTSVTDAQILEAKAVVDRAGIGAEPASCATVAGVKKMVEAGVISRGDHVVGILTGHMLKDADTTMAFHDGRLGESWLRNPPVRIPPSVDALEQVVDRRIGAP